MRWLQTLKTQILLENHHLPREFAAQIETFVGYCNHWRCHESLNNLTPAEVSFSWGQIIPPERKKTKGAAIEKRRLQHADAAA